MASALEPQRQLFLVLCPKPSVSDSYFKYIFPIKETVDIIHYIKMI